MPTMKPRTADHCSSCGSIDREDLLTGDDLRGYGSYRFGLPENFRRACCWGVAEGLFEPAGVPDGSSRSTSRDPGAGAGDGTRHR
jgi:hypothetical protein